MHIIPPLIHMQKATNSHVMFVQNATIHTKSHKTQHLTTKTKQSKKSHNSPLIFIQKATHLCVHNMLQNLQNHTQHNIHQKTKNPKKNAHNSPFDSYAKGYKFT